MCVNMQRQLRGVRENNADTVHTYGSLSLLLSHSSASAGSLFSHRVGSSSRFLHLFLRMIFSSCSFRLSNQNPPPPPPPPVLPPPPPRSAPSVRHAAHFPSSLPLFRAASIHPFISPCKNVYFCGARAFTSSCDLATFRLRHRQPGGGEEAAAPKL